MRKETEDAFDLGRLSQCLQFNLFPTHPPFGSSFFFYLFPSVALCVIFPFLLAPVTSRLLCPVYCGLGFPSVSNDALTYSHSLDTSVYSRTM